MYLYVNPFSRTTTSSTLTVEGCILCTGIMTLAEQLDYETCSQYHVAIAVHEVTGRADHLSTTIQLTIDVINVNDHAPTFTHGQHYRVFLSEDCKVGSFVIQLVAKDADSCHGDYLPYYLD